MSKTRLSELSIRASWQVWKWERRIASHAPAREGRAGGGGAEPLHAEQPAIFRQVPAPVELLRACVSYGKSRRQSRISTQGRATRRHDHVDAGRLGADAGL